MSKSSGVFIRRTAKRTRSRRQDKEKYFGRQNLHWTFIPEKKRFLLNRATASNEAKHETIIHYVPTNAKNGSTLNPTEWTNHASHLLPIMKEQFHHLLMHQPDAHFRITISRWTMIPTSLQAAIHPPSLERWDAALLCTTPISQMLCSTNPLCFFILRILCTKQ